MTQTRGSAIDTRHKLIVLGVTEIATGPIHGGVSSAFILHEITNNTHIYGDPSPEQIQTMVNDCYEYGDVRRGIVYGYVIQEI